MAPTRAPISPFQNSDMVATGLPSPEELKLLEPFRGKVPDEVFGEPFVPPVSDGSGQDRTLLRKASQLLTDAGLVVKDGKRLLPDGDVFKIEFLLDEPSFQPHHAPFLKNLGTLGIEATLARWSMPCSIAPASRISISTSPSSALVYRRRRATSMRPTFSSQAAATKGSYNLAGIADPVIDALIEKILAADTRAELTTACRAFDRVFRAGRYWVPHWYRATHPLAYWDVFDHPKTLPRYQIENYVTNVGERILWWYDAAKAAKLEQAK